MSLMKPKRNLKKNQVVWSQDLYLRRMGEQMVVHRSLDNYRPTYMKLAESNGAPVRTPPWINPVDANTYSFPGPRCIWPEPSQRVCKEESLEINEHKFPRRGIMASFH